MKKLKNAALMSLILLLVLTMTALAGCKSGKGKITEIASEDPYSYVNPDESKAEPDPGIVIDGVLDEAVYQNNNWLYLHNDDGGNNVNIAMTSYYGEKGMYFVYDVTESVPIYVNLDRASYMNSCIEMYLAPSNLSSVKENSIFEIDMMPTGDMTFKKSDGKYGYADVLTTDDKMAVLGSTTKGGAVNTPECYGYCLELFIPWDYMTWLKLDANAMKDSFVYVNPAHITSNNLNGTDSNLDRLWYFYAQQNGAEFTDVSQYFRFNGEGVIGTVPVVLNQGEHCTITGTPSVIPGMNTIVTITPDAGYALTSITVNGKEAIQSADFSDDGSITLTVRSTADGVTVSAKADAVSADGSYTLSGKISLNPAGSLKDAVYFYSGPNGERPLELDGNGNFVLKDLKEGYYVIKAEKEGYQSVSRGIYLNQNFHTELILEHNAFTATQGSCWILDDQNNGTIYKMGGTGVLMSNNDYYNFDYSVNLKYDAQLAQQGTSDYYLQQRSGMRIAFSNGKTWHIDLMKENDKYILQYAKFSGNDSVTNWRTVRVLNNAEVAKYLSEDGLRLRVMRQGQHAAVWLGNTLLVIEKFGDAYENCSAKLGMEFWVYNRTVMEIPFSISSRLPVNVAGSPFHWPAEIWDISNQYNGTFTKFPAPGKDTWLDGKIPCNDITTTCKDLSPEKKDYSMIYIFKFSNNESFRLRLNHTDDDGKFRIQSFAGSTLSPVWKNYYTLTDEQAQKALTDGVDYRVWISGTTAYVYIDGSYVCSIDLSTNVNTGAPSGIENATSTVSFRLDGNTVGNTVIPFKMTFNNEEPPEIIVPPSEISYNDFTAAAYLKYDPVLASQGTTDHHVQQRSGMKISFSNDQNWHIHMMKENDKYIVQYAKMSGDNSVFNWKTAHVLTEAQAAQYESAEGIRLQIMRQGRHAAVWLGDTLLVIELLGEEYLTATAKLSAEAWISGQSAADVVLSTAEGVPVDVAGSPFHWPAEIWDISNQYNGTITKHPAPGKDTWLDGKLLCNDVTTICKDLSPEKKDYSMIYIFKFSNSQSFRLRLNHTDNDGKFRIQSFAGSTLTPAWKNYYTLTDEQAQKALTDGVEYRVRISGTTAYVYIDGTQACTIDLSTNINTGAPSGIENATSTISFRMDGNTGGDTVIPFKLEYQTEELPDEPAPDAPQVTLNIAPMTNGTVTADQQSYKVGDTVTLTVAPNAGYAQKLYINEQPLLLDWKTNTYRFVATETTYEITGSFEERYETAPSDGNRWDASNQAHGILTTYYPVNKDSWWEKINGEYTSFTVNAKNYLPLETSAEGDGITGFSVVLAASLDNGKTYGFRIINEKDSKTGDIRYVYTRFGASGSVTGWGGWCLPEQKVPGVTEKLQGDGAEFKLTRTNANTLQISLDGVVLDTYTMDGVSDANKVTSVSIYHYGNKGQMVQIPFTLTEPGEEPDEESGVQVHIANMTNGTVTADQQSYKVGDTVTLTVTPADGYVQKLYLNEQPLLLDYNTGKYSFTVEEGKSYEVTGGFVKKAGWFWTADWNLINQGHGIAHAPAHPGSDQTGELVPTKNACNGVSVLVKDASHGAQKDYAIALKMLFAGNQKAEVRLIDRDDNGKYCLQVMGNNLLGNWTTLHWLTAEESAAVRDGDGVWFGMVREGTMLRLLINDSVVWETDLSGKGITANTALEQVKLQAYNFSYAVDIPYVFQMNN